MGPTGLFAPHPPWIIDDGSVLHFLQGRHLVVQRFRVPEIDLPGFGHEQRFLAAHVDPAASSGHVTSAQPAGRAQLAGPGAMLFQIPTWTEQSLEEKAPAHRHADPQQQQEKVTAPHRGHGRGSHRFQSQPPRTILFT